MPAPGVSDGQPANIQMVASPMSAPTVTVATASASPVGSVATIINTPARSPATLQKSFEETVSRLQHKSNLAQASTGKRLESAAKQFRAAHDLFKQAQKEMMEAFTLLDQAQASHCTAGHVMSQVDDLFHNIRTANETMEEKVARAKAIDGATDQLLRDTHPDP